MATSELEFIVTANRLLDGRVVYLAADQRWSERYEEGLATRDPVERDRWMAWAKTRERDVCGAYPIEITIDAKGRRQLTARERLRALGPGDARKRLGYSV
jgi:hypothetical protein